jgi:hypothetical protein
MASGLGTPLVGGLNASANPSMFYPGLAALMCWNYGTRLGSTTVTAISPHLGPAGHPRTVTITGTGFLPVAGADLAEIGNRQITAACTSTTRCTVRLPAMRRGTASIRTVVEDLTISRVTSASHYTIVAAPSVSLLSPAHGRRRGGNTVTIRGHNFVGVTAVHFGKKRATTMRVISPTKITVTAPAGSGTITVTVTAVGGTSHRTRESRYQYI